VVVYCIFYLTKLDKFVTWELEIILDKCKHEKTKAYEQIKKLRNAFLNAQQMSIQQSIYIYIYIYIYVYPSHYIFQQDHSNS
jgi:hypothetical protein